MPVLAQGNTANLTLGAHDSITLQNRAGQSASLTVAGTLVNGQHSGTRTYGPYANGGAVVLVATAGDVYYEVGDGAYAGVSNALVQVDTTGRPIRTVTADGQVVGGGGGGAIRLRKAAVIGDSRAAFGFSNWALNGSTGCVVSGGIATLTDNGTNTLGSVRPGYRLALGNVAGREFAVATVLTNNGSNSVTAALPGVADGTYGGGVATVMTRTANNEEGFVTWLMRYCPDRFDLVAVTAYNGSKVEAVRDGQIPWLLANQPDVEEVISIFGVNNYRSQSSNETADVVWEKMRACFDALIAAGKRIIHINEPQLGTAASNATNIARCDAINASLAAYAAQQGPSRMVVVDVCSTMRVGSVTDADYLQSDAIHPTNYGANLIGWLGSRRLVEVGEVLSLPERSAQDTTNLWPAAGLPGTLGAGNLPTDVSAPVYSGSASGTHAIVRTELGRAFEVNTTFTASTETATLDFPLATVASATQTEVEFAMWVADGSMLRGLQLRFLTGSNANAGYDAYISLNAGTGKWPAGVASAAPIFGDGSGGRWLHIRHRLETGGSTTQGRVRAILVGAGAGNARVRIVPYHIRQAPNIAA